MGNNDGMWRIAILSNIPNSMFLLELLLISSIKSIEINRRHENDKMMRNETKFSFIKYLIIILLLGIIVF